jgi:hypothetical protein
MTFPDPPEKLPPTPTAEIDAKLARLTENKHAWLAVAIPQRIAYLEKIQAGLRDVADGWVANGAKLKGISPGDPLVGEEWLAGPMTTARNVRVLIDALRAGGHPRHAGLETRETGQHVARVFPLSFMDRLMLSGYKAEIWIEPGKPPTQGAIYRERPAQGKVSLVLGGGNVSSIPPMDALYKLFVEDEVVLLKMNPVNEHVGPRIEAAFRSLVDDGFMAVVYGGADVGAYCAGHAEVDTLHVTGSDRTYDAIVWGSDPEERKRRKAANEPVNTKPFSAELGCVTPILIVPGSWSDLDIAFQARHVAGMITQNASFNCNAAKVLVTSRTWLHRLPFLDALHDELRKAPPRKAYYPGAQGRYEGFLAAYPKAIKLGAAPEGVVPWTVIPDVPPKGSEYALCNEAFCGVVAEVALDLEEAGVLPTPTGFLEAAVRFANEECWGTLSTTILIDRDTAIDCAYELDRAIDALRYGGIGVNCWAGVIYGLCTTTWGAYPGHPPTDIGSGVGVVHNGLLFDHPQKSVVYAPFRPRPAPPYVGGVKHLEELGRRIFDWELSPTWKNFFRVAWTGLKG